MNADPRSRIPSVDVLIDAPEFDMLRGRFGRERTVDAIRFAVQVVRESIAEAQGSAQDEPDLESPSRYVSLALGWLSRQDTPSLRAVINATGVVLHTNLGRAPLASLAIEAMQEAATGYCNLEYDVDAGVRGSRYSHCVSLLTDLTGAQDALVVNNAAGALVLALNTVALGRPVVVSRGELVEIGGGFRIPEVLERAGATMLEVGSTNRTRASDYAEVLETGDAAAVLKVHRSNFRITGFTEEAPVETLADVARAADAPLIHDLGSGLIVEAEELGLPPEPRAADSIAAGVNVVVISGDKLLGGPQSGIIVGEAELLARMRKNPLCRALRVDKVTLAGLEATLRLYRDRARALRDIPALRMLVADVDDLKTRAESLVGRLQRSDIDCALCETEGAVGGGTYPGTMLPSWGVRIEHDAGADALMKALRDGAPSVIGRVVDHAVVLDVRTLMPGQTDGLLRRVREAVRAAATAS